MLDISQIDHTHCARSYTGKIGCMCGCNGNYSDTQRGIKGALTKLSKLDYKFQFWNKDSDGIIGCVHADNGHRTVVVFLKTHFAKD